MATHASDVLDGRRRTLLPRTFRSRLTAIFIVIVLLPMLAVAVILFELVADVEKGRSDAQLAQAQRTAQAVFAEGQRLGAADAERLAASPALARALEDNDLQGLQTALNRVVAEGAARVVLRLRDGRTLSAGRLAAPAPGTTELVNRSGQRVGDLSVAERNDRQFANLLRRLTDVHVVIASRAGGAPVSTLPVDGVRLPRSGSVDVGGTSYRVSSFNGPDATGAGRLDVRLLADQSITHEAISRDTVVVGLLLLGFLLLAFAFALTVSRSLQAPVQRLLTAARRLGGGEFDVQVPEEGTDEFAALGTEFNAMARQLEARLEDLDAERRRLQGAIRRVGELSAAGLDRDAVLDIVVQTAMDGIGATAGRASARPRPEEPLALVAAVGAAEEHVAILDAAEEAALDAGSGVGVRRGDVHAFAQPLHPPDEPQTVTGLIAVARDGKPFTGGERDLFGYLASQASISIENVDLHRAVQRQAVTDELTGLFNHRRFQEVMGIEIERAKRFNHPLGLVMVDIDDFKLVNDRYGHLQGDQVLRDVARVLLETSREIDEPARYGGEEMTVVLPQTDLAGVALFADRLRERIEALEIPLVSGHGSVRVTASVGAAAYPESAVASKDALVAAADSALYRAKRLGKNRVVRAG